MHDYRCMFKPDALWSTCMLPSKLKFVRNPGRSERDTLKSKDSPSLHSGPAYDVMLQSQVKPSHCCKQTPWFEQESSWHVVLGPAVRDVSGSEGAKVRKKDTQTHFLLLVFSLEPSVFTTVWQLLLSKSTFPWNVFEMAGLTVVLRWRYD